MREIFCFDGNIASKLDEQTFFIHTEPHRSRFFQLQKARDIQLTLPASLVLFRGIVVHEHNAAIIEQAADQIDQHNLEQDEKERQLVVCKLWKKLMVGILVKQRVTRDYGDATCAKQGDKDDPVDVL